MAGTPTRSNVANVLVIGTGAAGLRAAIAAHQAGSEVVVLGKRRRDDAHTVLAAGGINAALGTVDPEDSWQQHFADTLREGYFLADPRVVELMAKESPAAVLELADWGAPFARTPDGRLDQRFFGAHRWRRTCYAGDWTGRAILRTLAAKVAELGLTVVDDQYVSQLLVSDGVCFGALAFDLETGERTVFLADAVVLAAGGHTRIWRRSSSRRDENTGDGMYLALRAGCRLQDMELVQFHPTGMVAPEEAAGTLVTEAVRGEGGVLRDRTGARFMVGVHPLAELAPRDVVAKAITRVQLRDGVPNVWLDARHVADLDARFPTIVASCRAAGIDPVTELIPVTPAAHYASGGLATDLAGRTTVPGLYACGEVACTGVHGANRLASNSLLEGLVFAARIGDSLARELPTPEPA
ncbi:MAG TPA: FAD-dependent oxidoreductase, partial [Actinomycetota bacterium]|nr:FAD-dependent oxidoreductase [Actinomycetota bacterium]